MPMTISDDLLPRILVVLHEAAQMLHETCPEAGMTIFMQIERWEQELLIKIAKLDVSITKEKFFTRCRQAPSQMLLQALIAQQEALRVLSENDYYTSLGGIFSENAGFWNEGGLGYWANQYGKDALASTWWAFHVPIREHIDSRAPAIEQIMRQLVSLLADVALEQQVKGVIEPLLQRLHTTYQKAFVDRKEPVEYKIEMSSACEGIEM